MYFPEINLDMQFKAFEDDHITTINLKDYKGKNVVLLFYPNDFTFVCPTELNVISDRKEEFARRNTVVFLISNDSVYSHKAWAKLPRQDGGVEGIQWPMLSDSGAKLSGLFGFYDQDEDITKRATLIFDTKGEVKYTSIYNDMIGRSTDEILRIIDAINFTAEHGEICPMDWNSSSK
ncbi:thioredoxin peroxidase [Vairimorpha necatrix]|uniref:Thioredoxin peroxidase n=1 Tax=Vairimorpha necatrix TaxID=6039 RepID=A0AAX4JFM5_9MICR